MRKLWTIPLAAALLFGCQNANRGQEAEEAPGQTGSTGTMGGQASTGTPTSVTGTLTRVSDDEVQVRSSTGEPMSFDLDDSVQITANGQPAQQQALQEGSQVRATYTGSGDDRKLQQLEVIGGGSMGTTPGTHGMEPGMPGSQPGTTGSQQGTQGSQPGY